LIAALNLLGMTSRIWLFFLSLIPFSAFSQTTSYVDFKLDNQEIIYQKVFPYDSVTVEKLGDFYVKLPYVSDFDRSSDRITFKINDVVVDYKKFQFSQVSTPSIIQTGKYSGEVSVDIKDGKYRVTVRKIQLTGDIVYKKITAPDNLTNYACRNNGTYISSDWCKPNTLGLLAKAFTDKLQYVESDAKKDNSDW
jgi:hypothetical protein